MFHSAASQKKSVAQIARDVGFIFQNPANQFYQDTVKEEIEFVLKNFKYEDPTLFGTANRVIIYYGNPVFIQCL